MQKWSKPKLFSYPQLLLLGKSFLVPDIVLSLNQETNFVKVIVLQHSDIALLQDFPVRQNWFHP